MSAPPADIAPLSVSLAALHDVAFSIGVHLRSITLRARAPNAPLTRPTQPSGAPAAADRTMQKLVALLRVFCDNAAINGFDVVTVDLQRFQITPELRSQKRWRTEVVVIDDAE